MELDRAMEIALDGDAVLFTGAGFSLGATNLLGRPFLTGPQLAKLLAGQCGLPEDTRLEDAAEVFLEDCGADELISLLQREFTCKKVASHHRVFARVPWTRVYTANYDDVLEKACSMEGRKLIPMTASTDIRDAPKDETLCIHLNGYVEALTRSRLQGELKLTDWSFVTSPLRDSRWAVMFRNDVRIARAVFFVGYSVDDLDIRRVLVESGVTKARCVFIIGSDPDPLTERRAAQHGTVVRSSAEGIGDALLEKQRTYAPRDAADFYPLSLIEYRATSASKEISDRDFIDLLLLGRSDPHMVAESLRTDKTFYLERTEMEQIFDLIDGGHRVIAISSDLGNGKSLFLEGLRYRALEHDYRVFDVNRKGMSVASEIQRASALPAKVLVTIDGYQDWMDEIRTFCLNASDRAVLILSARSGIHDVLIDDLTDLTGVPYLPEIRLDKLDGNETQWIVDAFDSFGLWGRRASWSPRRKAGYIRASCRSEFHAVLLRLLESPDIRNRLQKLGEQLRKRPDYQRIVITAFVLTILQRSSSLDLLADICGAEALRSRRFRRDPLVRQLIDFDRHEVVVRSAVAAQCFLRSLADRDLENLVSVLTLMARKAHNYAGVSREHWDLFKDLVRFGSLQYVLPERGRRPAVIRYYEALKNLPRCSRYPLFWLQYAIACLVISELERAKMYFDTAYSLARGRGWALRQIDNHYARFLLVEAVRKMDDPGKAMTNFRRARRIINRQIKSEPRTHHPYRVASEYTDFIDQFGVSLSPAQLEEVSRAATFVLSRIERLDERLRTNRRVQRCSDAMEYVCDWIAEMDALDRDGGSD